ncbi:hypothetical protein ABFV80_003066 [Vandammella animalimorsus]|uniref:hypothetical protein n=1 Tax=Vandammella animalimorsus TaxID=2029117 RepID=UPI00325BB351
MGVQFGQGAQLVQVDQAVLLLAVLALADAAVQGVDVVVDALAAGQQRLAQVAQGVALVLVFGGNATYRGFIYAIVRDSTLAEKINKIFL